VRENPSSFRYQGNTRAYPLISSLPADVCAIPDDLSLAWSNIPGNWIDLKKNEDTINRVLDDKK
jgi:hypothetical protein